ncbi:MAG: methyltransferase domain-containing protein [Chloroflexi bacterium]|nr:methyltransferase domain-containing protein [Chloroflexota bacterium]
MAIDVGPYLTVPRIPHGYAQWLLMRDAQTYFRIQFLYFSIDAGLLKALRSPRTRDQLRTELGVTRPDLLDRALDLGVAVKELALKDGRYTLRGRRARTLALDDGDQLVAMIDELATYHASVYRDLASRMRGAPPGDYLDQHATVIARSSRVLEPFLARFVRTLMRDRGPIRLLEIGCGSGIYLREAAAANPAVTGIAVDIQPAVAEQARINLAQWGIGDRFTVAAGDIRHPPPEVAGDFDLITMHQNIYYFQESERTALFEGLRARLRPGGRYVLSSFMRGQTPAAIDFDIALRCTAGCAALPAVDDLVASLRASGFDHVEPSRLMPLEPRYGLIAR